MLVCYEALVANPAHHVSQSQIFCDLPERPFQGLPTRHRRQADGRNEAFVARLRAALAARVLSE